MLFNSLPFAAFLFVTFAVYYFPGLQRYQVQVLIGASMVFYAWTFPALLLLLVASVLVNTWISYRVGLDSPTQAWRWACAGVVANLGVIAFFKYGGLLANTFEQLATGRVDWPLVIPLPIGISFYTFEGISLLVDTLRQRRNDQHGFEIERDFGRHLRNTALFVAFFPHLIAGPILKARHFFPQIGEKRFRDIPWEVAIRTLVVGYFLKTVVADNLKDYTFWIAYPSFEALSGRTALVLLYGYSIQIFADFAGYSLIAIGLAQLFGYELPTNFYFPYVSKSLGEFWRRWHISLSTWLRDYLYFPLGGNRKGNARTYFNLMAVMVLGGLWHGAGWSYMVWGGYHGIGLAVERLVSGDRVRSGDVPAEDRKQLVSDCFRVLGVFLFVSVGWLLFKLPEFSQVLDFLRVIWVNRARALDATRAVPVALYSLPVLFYYWWNLPQVRVWRTEGPSVKAFKSIETFGYAVAIVALFVNAGSAGEFIYFQF